MDKLFLLALGVGLIGVAYGEVVIIGGNVPHELENMRENTPPSDDLGLIFCNVTDKTAEYVKANVELKIEVGSSWLKRAPTTGWYASISVNNGLDYEIKNNQNAKDIVFVCNDGLAEARLETKIQLIDVNDNPPIFIRTGQTGDSYQVVIDEIYPPETILPMTIIENNTIIVTDIDGVDNNAVTAKCLSVSYNNIEIIGACDTLFTVKERNLGGLGRYEFIVEALRRDYSAYTDGLTMKIQAVNIPEDPNEPTLVSPSQNVVINVKDIQNQLPVIVKDFLRFEVIEHEAIGFELTQGGKIQAFDGDVRDPNPIRFELDRDENDPYAYDMGLFRLGRTFPPSLENKEYSVELLVNGTIDREAIPSTSPSKTLSLKIKAIEYAANGATGDRNPQMSEDTINIVVLDLNDQPPLFNERVYRIDFRELSGESANPENFQQISNTITIIVEDKDFVHNSFTLNIIEGNNAGNFRLNKNNGTGSDQFTLYAKEKILDYETSITQFNLKLEAVDINNPNQLRDTADVQIYLQDVNDHVPEFGQAIYYFSIPEDATINSFVGQIQATDLDSGSNGQIKDYSTPNSDALATFMIYQNGSIYLIAALDYEVRRDFWFLVSASDMGPGTELGFATVTVAVQDLDDIGPTFKGLYYTQVFEEDIVLQPALILISQSQVPVDFYITEVDPVTIDPSYFKLSKLADISNGEKRASFELIRALDYKDTNSGRITVTVQAQLTSSSGLTSSTSVFIDVIDLNNYAPNFTNPNVAVYISEAAKGGDTVIDLDTEDLDGNTTDNGVVKYSIFSGANDRFVIGQDTGVISVSQTASLDIDDVERYNIRVRARDLGNPVRSSERTVTVILTDANNKVPVFRDVVYTFQLEEGANVGKYVGTVYAEDPDTTARLEYKLDKFSFIKDNNIVNRNIDGSEILTINTTGSIIVKGAVDRGLYDRMDVQVIAIDVNGEVNLPQTGTASVVITILASTDPTIYFLPPWTKTNPVLTTSISESTASDYQLYTLSAKDPRSLDFITTFRKVPNYSGNEYMEFRGRDIYVTKQLDYEKLATGTAGRLVMVIEALSTVNGEERTGTATFSLLVSDLNDNQPEFVLPTGTTDNTLKFYVDEDKQSPFVLGEVLATDADSGSYGAISYAITDDSNAFELLEPAGRDQPTKLIVGRDAQFEYSTRSEYNFQITATDNANQNSQNGGDNARRQAIVNVVVHIIDKNNHAPKFRKDPYDFEVIGTADSDNTIEIEVGRVVADDPDTGLDGTVEYSIRSATNEGQYYFGIRTETTSSVNVNKVFNEGQIFVRNSLESLSDRARFDLIIVATDKGIERTQSGTTTVEITVNKGVRDPKPIWDDNLPVNIKIVEHVPIGYYVTTAIARPSNVSSSIFYSFVSSGAEDADSKKFLINTFNGTITVAADIDYEDQQIYSENNETKQITLLIKATDTTNSTYTNQYLLIVEILDKDDNTPTFTSCESGLYPVPVKAAVQENVENNTFVYQAVACDRDQPPHNAIQYEWYIDGNNKYCKSADMARFRLDRLNGRIYTNSMIDREVTPYFLLCVEASVRGSQKRKRRDMTSDLQARTNHDTVLYVYVEVLDANDNGPTFTIREDVSVILEYPTDTDVSVAIAYDPDNAPFNDIHYSIVNITFTYRGKTQQAPAAFVVNSNDGSIANGINDYSDYVGGYFELVIRAEDVLDRSMKDIQHQRIYVTSRSNQIRVVFNRPADQGVDLEASDMVSELNNLEEGVYYEIKKISYHVRSSEEDPSFDKTDVCLVVVRSESVMSANNAAIRLNDVSAVAQVLGRYGAIDPGPCDPARSVYPKGWESYWWVLVAFAIFIFVCVIICIFIIVVLHRQYKRYMDTRKTYLVPN